MKNTYSVNDTLERLKAYCSYQERCHIEVRKKLKSMGLVSDSIDFIMVELIKQNYLNETRFAKAFINGKFRIKYWGKIKIMQELKNRNISESNIDIALSEISEDEYLYSFNKIANKKWNNLKDNSIIKKKKKWINYLLYRGWETHLIYSKIDELMD